MSTGHRGHRHGVNQYLTGQYICSLEDTPTCC